ncbi:hypothetical protein WMZ97_01490 [Lentibacillus sp. N15]|uniref:hypothetical protein n=1 Tax=Lentibacillus songyuanensis TaxID=3136161 RepID=UPI0031BA4260
MGLFMNQCVHPEVFVNQEDPQAPNQEYFQRDYFAELVKSQQNINDSLNNSVHELRQQFLEQRSLQKKEWMDVFNQLKELRRTQQEHDQFEANAQEWIRMLDENNQELSRRLDEEGLLKGEVVAEMNQISESNQAILDQIGTYESLNKQLAAKMDELFELQQTMSNKVSTQHESQEKALTHLENQDALLEKTLRQVTNIRSILFERTSYLVDKIEKSYKRTSSFVYHLMTGSDQPLNFLMEQKREETSDKQK